MIRPPRATIARDFKVFATPAFSRCSFSPAGPVSSLRMSLAGTSHAVGWRVRCTGDLWAFGADREEVVL